MSSDRRTDRLMSAFGIIGPPAAAVAVHARPVEKTAVVEAAVEILFRGHSRSEEPAAELGLRYRGGGERQDGRDPYSLHCNSLPLLAAAMSFVYDEWLLAIPYTPTICRR